MKVLTSTLASELENIIDDFENTFGFGICGAYSTVLRSKGYGDVAVCNARIGKTEFPHYILVSNGDIIDLTNPFDEELTYSDIEILDHDEMPELVDNKVTDWIQERI